MKINNTEMKVLKKVNAKWERKLMTGELTKPERKAVVTLDAKGLLKIQDSWKVENENTFEMETFSLVYITRAGEDFLGGVK